MVKPEVAKAQVFLDGQQAETVLESLKKESKLLRKELKEAFQVGDATKIAALESQIKKNEQATRSLKKETYDYAAVLKNINGASYVELNKALKTTQTQLQRMKQTDAGYKDKAAEVQQLKTKIAELNNNTRATTSIWSKMSAGANKYMSLIGAGLAAITGVGYSVVQLIKGITGLDDALANVQKTTGLTRKEVRELYGDFKTLNTRTSKSVLLEYAEEAGRLGKKGKKDVLEFVEVANKIGTALGDDLANGPEAIREVGKLVEIYKVGNQYNVGFGESMEKIGSAINEIGANSSASAPYQIDFLKRLSGTAMQANITAAEIMGYSSVLEQNGQAVEMAATAHGKLMMDMFTKPGEYAEIAGMKLEDFTKLLETDANEAFLMFLKGINGNNEGFTKMAVKLDELGVDGSRAVQVLATLASNTDNVRKEQALANKAMTEGVSLTNEYNIKNNNLAGSWEKIGAALKAKFINPQLIGFMEKLITNTAKLTEVSIVDTMAKERTAVNALVLQLTSANITAEERNRIYNELKLLAPDVLEGIDQESIKQEVLNKNLIAYNNEMINKIILQKKDLEVEDQNKKVAETRMERLELEAKQAERIAQLYDIIQKQAKAGMGGITGETAISATSIYTDSTKTLEEKYNAFIDILSKSTLGYNKGIAAEVANTWNDIKKLNDAEKELMDSSTKMAEERKKLASELGISSVTNTGGAPTKPTTPPPGGIVEIKKRTVEVINEEIAALQKEQTAMSDNAKVYQQYQAKITTLEKERESITKESLNTKNRTIEVINAEIAALQKEQQTRSTSAKVYQEYQAKIDALEKESLAISGKKDNDAKKEDKDLKDKEAYFEQLLEKTKDYDAKLNDLVLKYYDDKKLLEEQGLTDHIAVLDEQLRADLDALNGSNEAYAWLFRNIENYSRKELKQFIEKIKTELAIANISTEKRIELNKKLAEATDKLDLKGEQNLKDVGAILGDLSGLVGMFDEKMGKAISTAANLANAAASIAAGMATGNPIAIVQGVIQGLTAVISLIQGLSDKEEKRKKIQEEIENAKRREATLIDYQNRKLQEQINLIKELNGLQRGEQTLKTIEEIEAAIKGLDAKYDYDIKLLGGTMHVDTTMEKMYEMMMSDIERGILYTQESIDAITADYEQYKEWTAQQKELMAEWNEYVTGTTADALGNEIVDMFLETQMAGDDFIEKFGEKFDDTMRSALINQFKNRVVMDAVENWYESFAALGRDDDGFTAEDAAKMRELWNAMMTNLNQEWDSMTTVFPELFGEEGGLDIAGASDPSSKGFGSMTQETANELNGRFTALQASNEVIKLETIKMGTLIEDMKGMQLTIYSTLVEIRDNTNYLPRIDEKLGKIETLLKEA